MTPQQTLLLRSSIGRAKDSFEVSAISGVMLERDVLPSVIQRDLDGVPFTRCGALEAYMVYKAQRPDAVNRLEGGGISTADLMPSGVHVLDQLENQLRHSLSWSPLLAVAQKFQTERIPTVDDILAAREKKQQSLAATATAPVLQSLPSTHIIMKGMGPSDAKILLGDYSLAKRPRMAVVGGPTRAARRRARKRLLDKMAKKTLQPASTAVGGPADEAPVVSEPDQLSVQAPAVSEPDQPSVRSFKQLVYLAMEEVSDEDLIPDIGSDGSEHSQEDG